MQSSNNFQNNFKMKKKEDLYHHTSSIIKMFQKPRECGIKIRLVKQINSPEICILL